MKIKKSLINYNLLMIIILLNIVLNYAFSNIVIGFVPINQIVCVFFFFSVFIIEKNTSIQKNFIVVLILFLFYLVRLPYCIYKYGIFALRDGTHYLDMLFLIYSFFIVKKCVSKNAILKDKIIHGLYNILQISWGYYFLKTIEPINGLIVSSSPLIHGIQKSLPLFGFATYCSVWAVVLLFLDIWKVATKELNKNKSILVGIRSLITLLLCFFGNGRSVIIGFLILIIIIFITSHKIKKYLTPKVLLISFITIIFVITGLSINMNGRVLSAEHFFNLALSVVGKGDYSGKAAGTEQRLEWWYKIWKDNTSKIEYFLFGRGFGVALTDFVSASSTIVREPHNSFVSVFARQGIFGLTLWCFLLFKLFRTCMHRLSYDFCSYLVVTVLVLFITISLVEPVFENSYAAIPIYSIVGICLAIKNDNDHTNKE